MRELLDELELDPERNHEREVDDGDDPLVDASRTASMAFGLGLGRPSVRLEPK